MLDVLICVDMGEGPYSRKSVSYMSFIERLHGLCMVLLILVRH